FALWIAIHLLVTAIGIGVTFGCRHRKSTAEPPPARRCRLACWRIPIVLVLLVALGWAASSIEGRRLDAQLRNGVLAQARAVARTLDPELIRALSLSEADRQSEAFRTLRSQLAAYAKSVGIRSLFTMGLREGRIVFGPESLAETDPLASPPGTVFDHPALEDWECLRLGKSAAFGPVTDEYGTFVRAVAPVTDRRTGKVLLAVGMDVPSADWSRRLSEAMSASVRHATLLSLVVIACVAVLSWKNRTESRTSLYFRHAEAILALFCGCLITLAVGAWVRDEELRDRGDLFWNLAHGQAEYLRHELQELDDDGAALARFMQSHPDCDQERFSRFAGPLVRDASVHAMAWVPRVTVSARRDFEDTLRGEGHAESAIFERDEAGVRRSAGHRDRWDPVRFVEPQAGNETLPGFDLSSESVRRAALERAGATRLRQVTQPIRLVQVEGSHAGLLAVYPCFDRASDEAGAGRLLGHVVLAIRASETLKGSWGPTVAQRNAVVTEFYQGWPGDDPVLLYSDDGTRSKLWSGEAGLPRLGVWEESLQAVFPIFAFGGSFLVAIHPGTVFDELHPTHLAWWIVVAGFAISIAVAVGLGVQQYRQEVLQNEVADRTRMLTLRTTELEVQASETEKSRLEALKNLVEAEEA
ncbi:MAG: CHASE domain-containing protein, partial [Verrucomicrobiales bacterium]|nr:CHASE domain-containing protein [Verrucomicrobiales bacterium]